MEYLVNFIRDEVDRVRFQWKEVDDINKWTHSVEKQFKNNGYSESFSYNMVDCFRMYIFGEKEEWRNLAPHKFPSYEISSLGFVRVIHSRFILRNNKRESGYYCLTLTENGQQNYRSISVLLALAFIPNPDDKPTVDHIDKNRENNKLNNLKWATCEEQAQNRRIPVTKGWTRKVCQCYLNGAVVKIWESAVEIERTFGYKHQSIIAACKGKIRTSHGFIWKYHDDTIPDLPDEIWKIIPLQGWERYSASSKGRIKKEDGRLLNGTNSNGYICISIKNNGGVLVERLHRLIAITFLGPPNGMTVNHDDGNKKHNSLENWEFMTYSQNNLHALRTGLHPNGR